MIVYVLRALALRTLLAPEVNCILIDSDTLTLFAIVPKARAYAKASPIVGVSLKVRWKLTVLAKDSAILAVSVKPLLKSLIFKLSVTETMLFLFIPDSVARSSLALAVSSKLVASVKTRSKVAVLEKDSEIVEVSVRALPKLLV